MNTYTGFENFSLNTPIGEIECIEANPIVLKELGEMILPSEFDNKKLTFNEVKDASTNRPMVITQKETIETFHVCQYKGYILSQNHTIKSNIYTVAKLDNINPYKFYIREVYYHPECSKIIMSKNEDPFILVLGKTPRSLKAYIFNGSSGFSIFPGIWHQSPIIHYTGKVEFLHKQGDSRISVIYDSMKEHKKWMSFSYI
jgi:ureidoglycolate hydrolase